MTASVISKWDLIDEDVASQQQRGPCMPHYLHATTKLGAHPTVNARINSLPTITLVDSGATGIFMHQDFAQDCGAKIRPKLTPQEVWVIHNHVINSGLIIHEATMELTVGSQREEIVANLTNIGRYSCILGTPWLVQYNPTIR